MIHVLAVHNIHSIYGSYSIHSARSFHNTHSIKAARNSGVGLICACSSIVFLPLYHEISDPRPLTIIHRLRVRKGIHLEIFAVPHGFAVSFGQTLYVSVLHSQCSHFLDPPFRFLMTRSTRRNEIFTVVISCAGADRLKSVITLSSPPSREYLGNECRCDCNPEVLSTFFFQNTRVLLLRAKLSS